MKQQNLSIPQPKNTRLPQIGTIVDAINTTNQILRRSDRRGAHGAKGAAHGAHRLGSLGNMDAFRMFLRPRNSMTTLSNPIPPPPAPVNTNRRPCARWVCTHIVMGQTGGGVFIVKHGRRHPRHPTTPGRRASCFTDQAGITRTTREAP